jgi:hypothetical protein
MTFTSTTSGCNSSANYDGTVTTTTTTNNQSNAGGCNSCGTTT